MSGRWHSGKKHSNRKPQQLASEVPEPWHAENVSCTFPLCSHSNLRLFFILFPTSYCFPLTLERQYTLCYLPPLMFALFPIYFFTKHFCLSNATWQIPCFSGSLLPVFNNKVNAVWHAIALGMYAHMLWWFKSNLGMRDNSKGPMLLKAAACTLQEKSCKAERVKRTTVLQIRSDSWYMSYLLKLIAVLIIELIANMEILIIIGWLAVRFLAPAIHMLKCP